MIPYDDLVAALTAWRARQGLPVAQPTAAPPAPARKPATPAAAAAPAASARPAAARTAAAAADLGDFEDSALVEDASYDSGEDYVMQLGAAEQTAEPTAIGATPEPTPAGRGKRDKW